MPTELDVHGVLTRGDLPEDAKDELPHEGDSWTYNELVSMLTAAAARAPDATIYVLVAGFDHSSFDRHLFTVSAGSRDFEPVGLSLSEDEPQPAVMPHDAAPEQTLRLRTDAAAFVEGFESEDESAAVGDAPNEIVLPFSFDSPGGLLDAAARLSAELEQSAECLVLVAGRLGWLTMDPAEGAALAPVYCWHGDEELRAWIRAELPPPAAPARRAVPPFASFSELRDHVFQRYTPQRQDDEDGGGTVSIVWSWSNTDRTQLVDIDADTIDDEEWVVISSGFAPIDAISLEAALARATECKSSFLRTEGDYRLAIKLPLDALRATRLEAVLGLVAAEADDAEEDLLGTDEL